MYLCSYRGSSAPPVLLLNVTLTNPRNSVSEGMSLLTFTRCLQIVSAASSVSALYQCAGWSWKITAPTLWGCDRSNSALQLMAWFISVYLDYLNYLPAASSCVLVLIDCNKRLWVWNMVWSVCVKVNMDPYSLNLTFIENRSTQPVDKNTSNVAQKIANWITLKTTPSKFAWNHVNTFKKVNLLAIYSTTNTSGIPLLLQCGDHYIIWSCWVPWTK